MPEDCSGHGFVFLGSGSNGIVPSGLDFQHFSGGSSGDARVQVIIQKHLQKSCRVVAELLVLSGKFYPRSNDTLGKHF